MQRNSEMDRPLLLDPRYRSLDLWRGVACLMVLLHHAGFVLLWNEADGEGLEAWLRWLVKAALHGMNVGVPLFFVISGYCIAAAADGTRRQERSSLVFLARRVRRIYPPYWASIGFYLLVIWGARTLGKPQWLGPPYPNALEMIRPEKLNFWQWVGNITLTETWRPHVGGGPQEVFTRVAWSLCFEEQFYLVVFASLLLFRRSLYKALVVVTIVSGLLRIVLADIGAFRMIDGVFPQLWHEFAVGVAVYLRLNVTEEPLKRRALEGFLVAVALMGLYMGRATTPVGGSTTAAALFGLLLIALRPFDTQLNDSRWLRPIQASGLRSYSIYLVHLPVTTAVTIMLLEAGITGYWMRVFVSIPIVCAVALVVCWAFYELIERRFLNPLMSASKRQTSHITQALEARV